MVTNTKIIRKNKNQILIVIVARIGDTLLVTPAISAIRKAYPSSKIDVIAHAKRFYVLKNNLDIDKLFRYDNFFNLKILFPVKQKYDTVFFFGGNHRLLKYARHVGFELVGFTTGNTQYDTLLDVPVPPPKTPLHAIEDRMQLVKKVGIGDTSKQLKYVVSSSEKKWAKEYLLENKLTKSVLIGFQVAGFPTKPYRDWPTKYFIELGVMIGCDFDAQIVLFGAKKDNEKATSIASSLNQHAHWPKGKTTLRQSAALMSQLDLFVTTDTGPMHIAFALGIKTVSLFHCMHPGRYLGPLTHLDRHRVIQMTPPSGQQCSRTMTMDSIVPKQVYRHVRELLLNDKKEKAH